MLDQIDIASVSSSVFLPHLNSKFSILAGEGDAGVSAALTLVEVADYPDHRSEAEREQGRRTPFGLVFRSDLSLLGQGTYRFSHPELPTFDLFITPIGGGEDWSKVEAVIN